MRKAAGIAIAAASLAAVMGAALLWFNPPRHAAATATAPVWNEVAWPFPMDLWGRGKAFRCKAADCGAEVTLYVRAKLGFCNCTKGVADDDDLDRMGDLVLVGDVSPLGSGRPVSIAWMKGRSRAYKPNAGSPGAKTIISIVYNERCDMIAATAVLGHDRPETTEPSVIEFLNSSRVMRWAEVTLGL
jgi:hypothetical protein